MKAERVVVDSNVLISALLLPGSTPHQVIELLAAHNSVLLFSDGTFSELVTRLARPKFDPYRTPKQLEAYLDWLSELGEWVVPGLQVNACRDSDDNKFLALAIAGEADCLISGDKDLLVLHPFEGIPIVSPAEFLATGAATTKETPAVYGFKPLSGKEPATNALVDRLRDEHDV